MNLLPLLLRELRAHSRRPSTYLLRVASASAVLVAFVVATLDAVATGAPTAGFGRALFVRLTVFLLLLLPAASVLWVADSFGQEKRAGTLGLLFLTPLRALHLVRAKAAFAGWLLLSAWLATLPAVLIPLTSGGVAWQDGVAAACQTLNALLAGLAGSLLAACFCLPRFLSFVLGTALVALFIGLTNLAYAGLILLQFLGSQAIWQAVAQQNVGPLNTALHFLETHWQPLRLWLSDLQFTPFQNPPLAPRQYATLFLVLAETTLCSLGLLVLFLRLGAVILDRRWKELPRTAAQLRWIKNWCSPRFALSWHRWRMNRTLGANPIGWLHQYSWSARLFKWGWLFLMGFGLLPMVSHSQSHNTSLWLLSVLIACMVLSAANSFHRERASGVLELLLVAPLTPSQILHGRLRGIWAQFLPAGLLWTALSELLRSWYPFYSWDWAKEYSLFAVCFLAAPVLGLRCSLFPLPLAINWAIATLGMLLSLAAGVILSAMMFSYLVDQRTSHTLTYFERRSWAILAGGIFVLLYVAGYAYRELLAMLRNRRPQFLRGRAEHAISA